MNIDIRKAWLDFYQSKGFTKIDSAPLVHPAFPTSFNASAGLVQLDPRIRMLTKSDPLKQCLVQKCVRYFDMNKVGDNRHLSFFEMAGAFEVTEINEEQTVLNVWEFLTKKLQINPLNLWMTIFDKDIVVDKEISLPDSLKSSLSLLVGNRLVYGKQDTNLWKQGGGAKLQDNIRLCGPQVETFYDFGKEKGCGKESCNPFCNCGRFLELSNILFISYYIDHNQEPTLKKLVNPATEAVIGIERCSIVLENKKNVFETSFFSTLVDIISQGALNSSIKMIVDHIKSLVFILSEEAIQPTKSGRGRIIRTLIRNMCTSFYVLGLSSREYIPLLIDKVIQMYEKSYPEISNKKDATLQIIFGHEKEYENTIGVARKKINQYLKKNSIHTLSETDKEHFWQVWGIQKSLIDKILNEEQQPLKV